LVKDTNLYMCVCGGGGDMRCSVGVQCGE
jgi:hypothetical protein